MRPGEADEGGEHVLAEGAGDASVFEGDVGVLDDAAAVADDAVEPPAVGQAGQVVGDDDDGRVGLDEHVGGREHGARREPGEDRQGGSQVGGLVRVGAGLGELGHGTSILLKTIVIIVSVSKGGPPCPDTAM